MNLGRKIETFAMFVLAVSIAVQWYVVQKPYSGTDALIAAHNGVSFAAVMLCVLVAVLMWKVSILEGSKNE